MMYKIELYVMSYPLPYKRELTAQDQRQAEDIALKTYKADPYVQGIRITDPNGVVILKRGVLK